MLVHELAEGDAGRRVSSAVFAAQPEILHVVQVVDHALSLLLGARVLILAGSSRRSASSR